MKKAWAKGLVNACLRRALREKEHLISVAQKEEMSFYAHSTWMIEHLKKSWPKDWRKILEANNQQGRGNSE